METNNSVRITDIEIHGMWGDTNVIWHNVRPDFNIVVGQNGFGKSTLLNILRNVLQKNEKELRSFKITAHIQTTAGVMDFDGKTVSQKPAFGGFPGQSSFQYVNTFDVPASRKSTLSQLGLTLDAVLYQRSDDVYSFSDYRLGMLKDLSTAVQKQQRINALFEMINGLFEGTGKKISIDDKQRIVFLKPNPRNKRNGGNDIIPIERLSAGEKQILVLLFTLFLMENKPAVLLLDEPEISLHIEWQDKLLNLFRNLNPNCQIILTTHSPNIFADGWSDNLVFISDLIRQDSSD